MSQMCEIPLTRAHRGVNSVMPWTTSIGPCEVLKVKIRRPYSSNGVIRITGPTLLTRRPALGTRWRNRELLFELAGVFVVNLLDLPFGDESPPQIVVEELDQLQGALAARIGGLGLLGEAGHGAGLALQDPPVLQTHLGRMDPIGRGIHQTAANATRMKAPSKLRPSRLIAFPSIPLLVRAIGSLFVP